METLNREFRDRGLRVLLVNLKEDPALVASFTSANGYTSTVLLDLEGEVARKYSVYGIPDSYLVDKKGDVVFRMQGYVDWNGAKLKALVTSLVTE